MKRLYFVVNIIENGKRFAIAETVRTGTNLLPIIQKYNTDVVHLCETRTQAEQTAATWNESYKNNGTYLFG